MHAAAGRQRRRLGPLRRDGRRRGRERNRRLALGELLGLVRAPRPSASTNIAAARALFSSTAAATLSLGRRPSATARLPRPITGTTFGPARTVRSRTVRPADRRHPPRRWHVPATRGRLGRPGLSNLAIPIIRFVRFVRRRRLCRASVGPRTPPPSPRSKHCPATFPAWPCDQAIAGVANHRPRSCPPDPRTGRPSRSRLCPGGRWHRTGGVGLVTEPHRTTGGSAPRPGGGCAGAAHRT
jgi:hypothetical protein